MFLVMFFKPSHLSPVTDPPKVRSLSSSKHGRYNSLVVNVLHEASLNLSRYVL